MGKKELMPCFWGRNWCRGHGRGLLTGVLLRAYGTQGHQTRNETTHNDLGLSIEVINQEYALQNCLRSISIRSISIRFLYWDKPSLCQANGQLIRTKSTQNFYFFSVSLSVHNMHMHECDCMCMNAVVCELQVLQLQKKSVLTCQDVRLSLKVLQLWRKRYPI